MQLAAKTFGLELDVMSSTLWKEASVAKALAEAAGLSDNQLK
jgi:hypothetical protein